METILCPQCGREVDKTLDRCNFCNRQLKVPYEPIDAFSIAALVVGLLAGVLLPLANRIFLGPILVMIIAAVGFLLAYPKKDTPFGLSALIVNATFFVHTAVFWYVILPLFFYTS